MDALVADRGANGGEPSFWAGAERGRGRDALEWRDVFVVQLEVLALSTLRAPSLLLGFYDANVLLSKLRFEASVNAELSDAEMTRRSAFRF